MPSLVANEEPHHGSTTDDAVIPVSSVLGVTMHVGVDIDPPPHDSTNNDAAETVRVDFDYTLKPLQSSSPNSPKITFVTDSNPLTRNGTQQEFASFFPVSDDTSPHNLRAVSTQYTSGGSSSAVDAGTNTTPSLNFFFDQPQPTLYDNCRKVLFTVSCLLFNAYFQKHLADELSVPLPIIVTGMGALGIGSFLCLVFTRLTHLNSTPNIIETLIKDNKFHLNSYDHKFKLKWSNLLATVKMEKQRLDEQQDSNTLINTEANECFSSFPINSEPQTKTIFILIDDNISVNLIDFMKLFFENKYPNFDFVISQHYSEIKEEKNRKLDSTTSEKIILLYTGNAKTVAFDCTSDNFILISIDQWTARFENISEHILLFWIMNILTFNGNFAAVILLGSELNLYKFNTNYAPQEYTISFFIFLPLACILGWAKASANHTFKLKEAQFAKHLHAHKYNYLLKSKLYKEELNQAYLKSFPSIFSAFIIAFFTYFFFFKNLVSLALKLTHTNDPNTFSETITSAIFGLVAGATGMNMTWYTQGLSTINGMRKTIKKEGKQYSSLKISLVSIILDVIAQLISNFIMIKSVLNVAETLLTLCKQIDSCSNGNTIFSLTIATLSSATNYWWSHHLMRQKKEEIKKIITQIQHFLLLRPGSPDDSSVMRSVLSSRGGSNGELDRSLLLPPRPSP